MFPGGGNSITIQINGTSTGLQAAVVQAQGSLNQLNQTAQNAGSGGFNAFQRFAITLGSIADLARTAADALSPITDAISGMVEQMFQLNVQTEKNVYGWQYLFGGKGQAAQLAQWSSQFSMNVPFTRQDLMGAISTLGAKFNANQVEQFMPVLADIASTYGSTAYGGQGISMSQAAYALIDLMMGRSMMFKQEFKIDPAQLVKYGLKAKVNSLGGVHIEDMSTLFPALAAYDKAHGIAGAAKGTAQNTWWGEWSSFQDRLQNFLLQAGGTDLNGTIRPNSLFGEMKKGLTDISNWMDAHQGQIKQLADIISQDLAGAFKTAASAAGDLFTGLQQSGLFEGLGITSSAAGTPTSIAGGGRGGGRVKGRDVGAAMDVNANAPPTNPWQQAGQIIGTALQTIGNDIQGLVTWFNTWHDAILSTAAVITGFFIPAMVKAGVEALISGAQITGQFIASIIKTGVEGWIAAGKLAIFIASLLATGVQAIINAAKVTASFVASMIEAGTQAVINAAKITATFVASLIETGAKAVATGAMMLASLVPAIITTTADFLIMAGTAIASAIAGFIAYIPVALAAAAATIAATWPILLIVVAVAAFVAIIILLVSHWTQVTTTLGKFKDGLAKDFGQAWNGLKTIIGNVWAWISDKVKGGINEVIDLLNKFIDFVNGIHIHIPAVSVGPVHTGAADLGFNIAHIPHLAAGGRIVRSGLAIVGEHGSELVHLPAGAEVSPHGGSSTRYGDSATHFHFYGAPLPQIERMIDQKLAQSGTMQNSMRRQPGPSTGFAYGWGSGQGSW